ncbi:MAG TPA: SDR family NAD(P)-dependent oxidoreductase [Caulobacteraceae bacterium]|nr:SDR family NAD(P)-dependent oxidoreductase [Caulobacteraceae bacterium]
MKNHPPMFDPQALAAKYGPWAVISGGTEGTGESFARLLAQAGINVMMVARRLEVMEKLALDLQENYGIETRTLVQDLMHPDAAQKILEASADLDVGLYISNAGVDGGPKRFLNQPAERWVRMINMNVINVAVAAHGFGNRLRQRRRGGLLIMASGAALVGNPYLAMYSSTKAFDLALAEALCGELSEVGVDVLGVIAPTMTTPLVMKGVENGAISFDAVFECDVVARQALAQLGHAPTIMFGTSSDGRHSDEVVEERYHHLQRVAAAGSGARFVAHRDGTHANEGAPPTN